MTSASAVPLGVALHWIYPALRGIDAPARGVGERHEPKRVLLLGVIHGFHDAYLVGAGIALVGTVVAMTLPRGHPNPTTEVGTSRAVLQRGAGCGELP